MAEGKTEAKAAEGKTEAKGKVDYVAKIGRNLNSNNADEIFGKGKGSAALDIVAKAGEYGDLTDAQKADGLAMPKNPETIAKINSALSALD